MKRFGIGQRRTQAFTLVEIMVSMAVLVIMMSFLFEFVLGAQRVWTRSSKQVEVYEQAQVIFDVLESDLKNLRCVLPDDNPDGWMQVYLDKEGNDRLQELCFLTSYDASEESDSDEEDEKHVKRVGMFPVHYKMISKNQDGKAPYRLYRYRFDRTVDSKSPFFCYSTDQTDVKSKEEVYEDALKAFRKAVLDDDNGRSMRELISEDIENLKIQVYPTSSDKLLEKEPISFRLTLTLRQRSEDDRIPQEKRTFTKIVFVNGNR